MKWLNSMAKREAKKTARKRTLKAARSLIRIQGEIIHAANQLHEEFFGLFATVIALERVDTDVGAPRFYPHALALWQINSSDRVQRELAFTALSTIPTKLKLKPAIDRIKWAKKVAGDLSEYRNLAAHSPIMFGHKRLVSKGMINPMPRFFGFGLRKTHQSTRALIDDAAFWEKIRDDLSTLADFVSEVTSQIWRVALKRERASLPHVSRRWPLRPKLPSLAEVKRIKDAHVRTVALSRG